MPRNYKTERDVLNVKLWLLQIAEERGMGYVDQGNSVTLTFNEDHKIPTVKEEASHEDGTKQHRAGRPRSASGGKPVKS